MVSVLRSSGLRDRPTAGEVKIDGTDTAGYGQRALADIRCSKLGFVFQNYHLRSLAAALANVEDGVLYRGLNKSTRRQLAIHALGRVGMTHRRDSRAMNLSGGEQQRVAIARAIVGRPDVILADEPTGNLDVESSSKVVDVLRSLNSEGVTVVLVTHDKSLAQIGSRRVLLEDGQLR